MDKNNNCQILKKRHNNLLECISDKIECNKGYFFFVNQWLYMFILAGFL